MIWLAALVGLPLTVWFAGAHRGGFEGKSLSNLSFEPLLVAVSSCVVFVAWLLVSRGGLKTMIGVTLLIILSGGAFAIQHDVPGLRE